ncbi:hypothetical protein DFH05DRAFT_1527932 [Lentinula detonsa]|uniref:Uncharacterized protein n=1 Tax=Lentinula detonsa TaxID=2804962 RepID=A0A9W8NWK2_9AGAR|nr:hypothetical protein DFH05DRAFT_1527932 [Lentinula detonsa]
MLVHGSVLANLSLLLGLLSTTANAAPLIKSINPIVPRALHSHLQLRSPGSEYSPPSSPGVNGINGDTYPAPPHVNGITGINGETHPTSPRVNSINGINGDTHPASPGMNGDGPTLPHVNGINGINGNPRLTPPRVNGINGINGDTHPTYEIWFSRPRPATGGSHRVPVDTARNVLSLIGELQHAKYFHVIFLEAQPASAVGFWYQATGDDQSHYVKFAPP